MPNMDTGGGGGWSTEQLNNARTIAQVGRSMGMSSRDILIGLMTALQESGMRNLNYGDRDSLGLFQQRPSAGWGSPAQVRNPRYAATKFFQGLRRIDGRNNMPLWKAAQSVQISAFPRAYAKHEDNARTLLQIAGGAPAPFRRHAGSFGRPTGLVMPKGLETPAPMFGEIGEQGMTLQSSTVPLSGDDSPLTSAMEKILDDGIGGQEAKTPGDTPDALGAGAGDEAIDWTQFGPDDLFMETGAGMAGSPLSKFGGGGASGTRGAVLNMAKKFIGVPYVWGGTTPSGFDCSGFIQYVLKKMGVGGVPRLAYQQANWGKQTSMKNIRPGDLVFWGNSRRTQGNHIAFYLGNGKILEAPRPGASVRIRSLGQWDKDDGAIGVRLNY